MYQRWEVRMAGEKLDLEMQGTGGLLARIHTAMGTEEIALMFDDAEDPASLCRL